MKKLLTFIFFTLLGLTSVFSAALRWNQTNFSGGWGDPSNWTLLSGTDDDNIPDSDDVVVIPAGLTSVAFGIFDVQSIVIQSAPADFISTFTDQVGRLVIGNPSFGSGTISTQLITMTGGASSLLVLNGSLSTSGDINMLGAQELRVFASQTLNVGGDLNRSTGTVIQEGTTFISGAYPSTGVTFGGNSIVNYNGSISQNVSNLTYDSLIFSGTGEKTISGAITYDSFTFDGPQDVVFDTDSPFIILIPDAGVYNTLTFKGTGEKSINTDLTVATLIIDPVDKPSVNYSGTNSQTVIDATYENLTFSNGGLKILPLTPTINGTFSAGSVDAQYSGNVDQRILPGTYNSLDLIGTGTKIIDTLDVVVNAAFTANDTQILITDGELNLNGLVDFGTSTVEFGRDGDQDVPKYGTPFYSLVISGTGAKTIVDATSISTIEDFSIESGGTLNLGMDTVKICGDININGNINDDGGTITIKGTEPTTISGSSAIVITNLNLVKTADVDVTIDGTVNIKPTGTITLTSSNDGLVVGSGSLTLEADGANSYATVAALPDGASITGNVNAQGYFNASTRTWWHVSSPVTSPKADDWINSGIFITGGFTGNSNDSIVGTDLQSMYSFDETSGASQNDSWVNFPLSSSAETMVTGRGYRIFIRDDASSASPKTATLMGELNQGDIPVPLSYTNTGDMTNDGFNLIGNPYPATLDWTAVATANASSLNATFNDAYVWNATSQTYNVATSIAPFQAFFVLASSGTSGLSLEESMKSSTNVALTREGADQNIINVSIQETDLERPFNVATTKIGIDPLATSGADKGLDQLFLSRNMFKEFDDRDLIDINTISEEGFNLSKNVLPESTDEQTIPLNILFSDYNEFSINVNLENYSYGEVFLEDRYLNTTTGLNADDEINYLVITDNSAASKASDRFVLKVNAEPLGLFGSKDKQSVFTLYPNPTSTTVSYQVNWSYSNFELAITDLLGNTVYSKTVENNSSSVSGDINVSNLEKGIYNVIITSGKNVETEKLIIK